MAKIHLSEEEKTAVEKYIEEGFYLSQIARKVKRAPSTIRNYCGSVERMKKGLTKMPVKGVKMSFFSPKDEYEERITNLELQIKTLFEIIKEKLN